MVPKSDLLAGYLTAFQAAEALGVHSDTFKRWRRLGYAPPETRIGKTPYFSREGVIAWIKSKEQKKPKPREEPRLRGRGKREASAQA